jgi:EAL domain-containing protein (putative c-di-GMP-specific phosphodiesterase class I)
VRDVAEGVENPAEAALLNALGVAYGQGWHVGRPGPVELLAPIVAPPARVPGPRAPGADIVPA